MKKTRLERLASLFQQVVDLDPSSREAYLSWECDEDPDLKDEVLSLIRQEADISGAVRTGSMLESAFEIMAEPPVVSERLGRYRLLETIGEGGMGFVYRAEQESPIRRIVAIKVLRSCLADKEAVGRFELEQQTLALMDHPYIAKVLDAGATKGGQAYFVMEFIAGEAITVYCDRRHLGLADRLRLFTQVCEGIQHAHRNAIIHRDIKPSNILVTEVEGRPLPRIIDFGVAKSTAHSAGEAYPRTVTGLMVGTPDYMSPEQTALGAGAVDTRTDVYSLGVLLYELLTGRRPFRADESGLESLLHRIRNEQPERPSAACRPRDSRRLRGDLDWILLKALEKNPARRYATPMDLATDVSRHLRRQPVLAGPPGALYRAGRFVRRHRLPVSLAGTLLVTLAGFAAVVSVQAARLAREASRANAEAAEATELAEFMLRLFNPASQREPAYPRSSTEMLDAASSHIKSGLEGHAILRARLLQAISDTYLRMAAHPEAHRALKEARQILTAGQVQDNELYESLELSMARVDMKEHQYTRAEARILNVIEDRTRRLGEGHPDTLRAMSLLGFDYRWMNLPEKALPQLEIAARGLSETLGPNHPEAMEARSRMASVLMELRRYKEAEIVLRNLLEGQGSLNGEGRRALAIPIYNLGCVLANLGRRREALAFISESIDLGFGHPGSIFQDPHLHVLRHDPELAFIERRGRFNNQNIWPELVARAAVDRRRGRHRDAETMLTSVLAAVRRMFKPNDYRIFLYSWELSELYLDQGRFEEARALLVPLVARRADYWVDPSFLAKMRFYLVQCDLAAGDTAAALQKLDEAVEPPGVMSTLANMRAYASAMRAAVRGDHATAVSGLRRAVELGFDDAGWLRRDVAFRPLHGLPEFEAIVRQAKQLEL